MVKPDICPKCGVQTGRWQQPEFPESDQHYVLFCITCGMTTKEVFVTPKTAEEPKEPLQKTHMLPL